jgi:small subunit ribosomal protein S6
MARQYEAVYIFDSALEEPAITEKLNRFHALVPQPNGDAVKVNHWGKRTLAFPVKKKESGHYVVAQFEATGDLLPEYERAVRLDEGVLRYLVVVNEGEPVKPVAPAAPALATEDDELEDEEEA